MLTYTGIGSRKTPFETLMDMRLIATVLEKFGWVLRSGGANGADQAFESGADKYKEIYLPWPRFNNSDSDLMSPSAEAMKMVSSIHPAWNRCSTAAKVLHARNAHQVLGLDLKTPSNLLICWTPGGMPVGGTATAIRIAEMHNVPVYNLATCDKQWALDHAQVIVREKDQEYA